MIILLNRKRFAPTVQIVFGVLAARASSALPASYLFTNAAIVSSNCPAVNMLLVNKQILHWLYANYILYKI